MSRSWVNVDTDAIAANVATLRAEAGGVDLCAVVKANGYGHGVVPSAVAALEGGASMLGVAQVGEAEALRSAGITTPILVLSEPTPDEFADAVRLDLQPTLYTAAGIEAAQEAARESSANLLVHLKIDTGMHRVGAAPSDGVVLAKRIGSSSGLDLAAVWTHLAVSEDANDDFAEKQLDTFDILMEELRIHGISVPLTHTGNTGGVLVRPRTRRQMVRAGIGIYGLSPGAGIGRQLKPALSWHSRVAMVKRLPAGSKVSYGRHGLVEVAANVATIPVGYADGFRRDRWERHGAVLIRGKRRRIVGVVTMDQFVVDCGDDHVEPGDEVVLIGRQGADEISAAEIAAQLETIEYEVVCAIGARVERRYVSDGAP